MENSKKFTKAELYWYIIGNTAGSGLFVCLPFAIIYAGKGAVISVIIAAFTVFFAVSYNMIISSMFPLKGGDYSQISFIAPPEVSGLYGITWLVSGVAISSFSVTAVHYFCNLFPSAAPYSKVMVVSLVTLFFMINYFGAKETAKIEGVMTVVLLVSLIIYIVAGIAEIDITAFVNSGGFTEYGVSGLLGAVGMVIWAVQGPSASAVGLAAEVEKPTKEVPKAILAGIVICTVLTLLVCFVAVGVLPVSEVIAAGDITVTAAVIFPKWAYYFFVIGAAITALLTTLMGNITIYRYPFMQLAEEGWLPPVFRKTTQNGWPYMCMLLMYVLSLIPVIFNISLDTIIAYCTMPAYFIYMYADLMCITLPVKYPSAWKHSYFSKIPLPLYYAYCIIAFLSGGFVCYCYCMGMGWFDFICIIGFTLLMFSYVLYCLKSGRVKSEAIQLQRDAIMAEILEYETEFKNM